MVTEQERDPIEVRRLAQLDIDRANARLRQLAQLVNAADPDVRANAHREWPEVVAQLLAARARIDEVRHA